MAALIGVPPLLVGVFGVGSGLHVDLPEFGQLRAAGVLLSVPLAVWMLATMWWDRVQHPRRAGTVWTVIALAGVIANLPMLIIGLLLAMLIDTPLMAFQGTGYPADGAGMLPGVAILALSLSQLMTRLLIPGQHPATAKREANTLSDGPLRRSLSV